MGKQQPGHQQLHHVKQHPKTKTHRQWTLVHTHSSSRHTERLPTDPSTRQTRPQQIQKDVCIIKKQIPRERHEKVSPPTLQQMPSLGKPQYQNTTAKKRTFLITPTTNGIHSNGFNRRIPPSIQQGQQIRTNSSMHAYRIHILHPTEV